MALLKQSSHRGQIAWSGALTAALVLALGALSFLFVDWRAERRQLLIERSATTQIVASNVAAAMLFYDKDAARETVAPLVALQDVDSAQLLDADGEIFVVLGENAENARPKDVQTGFLDGGLYTVSPVVADEEIIGALAVRSNLDAFKREMLTAGIVVAVLFLLGVGVAFIIAHWLANVIMRPVEKLSRAMAAIRTSGDLSERVHTDNSREFALLSTEFNALLDQLNINESELRRTLDNLTEARDEAQAANVAKSRFLANMSHELRTPLNAIIGYSALLAEDFEDAENDEAKGDVDRIKRAGEHLLSLINDVLDLSKIEAGKIDLELRAIDASAIVEDVLSTLGPAAERNGNTLNVTLDPSPVAVWADQIRLRQCLLNLLSNACKFTTDGTISLSVKNAEKDGVDFVVFEVEDTGIGMTPEQVGKLFNAFVQADSTVTRRFGGTGLGLAITRQLAEAMDGAVDVKSTPGEGSVFSLWAPAASSAAAARALESDAQASEHASRGLPTALIVEDDVDCAELLKRQLRAKGYDTRRCTNGLSVVAQARKIRPDIIFLDLNLPGRNGREILREITNDPDLPAVPVVVVSVDDDRRTSLRDGAAEHIVKPLSDTELNQALDAVRRRDRQRLLIVEAAADVSTPLSASAQTAGWEVAVASSPEDAIQSAAIDRPDAIVLGSRADRRSIINALKTLRGDPNLSPAPILLLAPKPSRSCIQRYRKSGASEVVAADQLRPGEIIRTLASVQQEKAHVA